MEKSVLRKDLTPTRYKRARAHRFKYNLPEREGAKKSNPPKSLILAQKMPSSRTWFPWERPLLAVAFCSIESLPQTSSSMQGWKRRGGINSAFRKGWSCQRGPWKANCAMRENREGGSLLTDTVKRLSKRSGRRAKRHFGAFIQMSSERWFEVKLLTRTVMWGWFWMLSRVALKPSLHMHNIHKCCSFKSRLSRRFYKHFSFVDPGALYKDTAINKMDGKVRNGEGLLKGSGLFLSGFLWIELSFNWT